MGTRPPSKLPGRSYIPATPPPQPHAFSKLTPGWESWHVKIEWALKDHLQQVLLKLPRELLKTIQISESESKLRCLNMLKGKTPPGYSDTRKITCPVWLQEERQKEERDLPRVMLRICCRNGTADTEEIWSSELHALPPLRTHFQRGPQLTAALLHQFLPLSCQRLPATQNALEAVEITTTVAIFLFSLSLQTDAFVILSHHFSGVPREEGDKGAECNHVILGLPHSLGAQREATWPPQKIPPSFLPPRHAAWPPQEGGGNLLSLLPLTMATVSPGWEKRNRKT